MAQTIHVMRHGEVENPEKILYGRQPGWRLSQRGQEMARVVAEWSKDFANSQGNPLAFNSDCKFRSVKSIPKVKWLTYSWANFSAINLPFFAIFNTISAS